MEIEINEVVIKPVKSMKYLGIYFDSQMNYGTHIRKTVAKADGATANLSRIMPNIGGANTNKRKMLSGVTHSILLYGAPLWSGMVEQIPAYQNLLNKSQRKVLLRVVSSYRTVSVEALQVITRTLPIDLMAKERRILYESGQGMTQDGRSTVRVEMIKEWQSRWDSITNKAQWTKQLIPRLEPWVNCKYAETNYQLTQFMSEHGSFRTYTHRIKKVQENRCIYCGTEDTAEHTICECPRWNEIRKKIGNTNLSATNIIKKMLASPASYRKIYDLIKEVMIYKEQEERAREKGEFIF